jgi:hypothetical protein
MDSYLLYHKPSDGFEVTGGFNFVALWTASRTVKAKHSANQGRKGHNYQQHRAIAYADVVNPG